MGEVIGHKPVKLIASIIYAEEDLLKQAEDELVAVYGEPEPEERMFPFDLTDYYEPEFGPALRRKLICFKDLVEIEKVPAVKLKTNSIEDIFRNEGKRTVNIDPGYVTEAKLVLLTTKDYTHRIYIGDKMFAELTLFFNDGTFKPWPWTYPDYGSKDLIDYFNEVRKLYMRDIGFFKGSDDNKTG